MRILVFYEDIRIHTNSCETFGSQKSLNGIGTPVGACGLGLCARRSSRSHHNHSIYKNFFTINSKVRFGRGGISVRSMQLWDVECSPQGYMGNIYTCTPWELLRKAKRRGPTGCAGVLLPPASEFLRPHTRFAPSVWFHHSYARVSH